MGKPTSAGQKVLLIVADEVLIPVAEVERGLVAPPEDTATWKTTQQIAQRLREAVLPINHAAILQALHLGDIEPFFTAVLYDPLLVLHPDIYPRTLGLWLRRKLVDPHARRLLRRLGSAWARTIQGNTRDDLRPNREAKAISAGVQRLERRYQRLLQRDFPDPDVALRQVVTEFRDRITMSAPRREAVLKQFLASHYRTRRG